MIINMSEKVSLDGYVRMDETSYDKLVNFHAEHGFCILTAFRSEYSLSENRKRNRSLMEDLKKAGLGFIKITGGYREVIDKDNPNFKDAEEIEGETEKRLYTAVEESLLVPNYDIKEKREFMDFSELKALIVDLGTAYEQDCVLISPPKKDGGAYYVVTNPRYGNVGDLDMQFNGYDLASISDTYFSSLSKTINKLKVKQGEGVGGFRFERRTFLGSFLEEPRHTIAGKRCAENTGAIAPFGSHYYPDSTLSSRTDEVKTLQVKKLRNAVYGKDPLVKTWGIMTAENPMGNRSKSVVNKHNMLSLKRDLKQRGLEYIPVKGKYGSKENSLFILNVRMTENMSLSREYDQESFIYAECRDGYCDAFYYEKGAGKDARYVLKHQRNHILDMSDADDFFSSICSKSKRAFKFQIPFFDGSDSDTVDVEENLVHALNRYVIERYAYQGIDTLQSMIEETFSSKITERKRHSLRSEIYETKEARVKRLEKSIASLRRTLELETTRDGRYEIRIMIQDAEKSLESLR